MNSDAYFEKMCSRVSTMGREQLIEQILHFHGHFKLDFTEAYLAGLGEEKLRHILLAAFVTEAQAHPV